LLEGFCDKLQERQVSESGSEPCWVDSETLFRRYAAFVASFLHRLGARHADLDDLVQEVFMAAHRKGGYRPGAASPTTFLARLALEARLSSQRRNGRWRGAQREDVGVHVVALPPHAPDRCLALHQAAAQLECVLDGMEPGARAVFVLFELEGQSCEAIAAGLDLKLGTVYSRLHTARRVFAAKVARTNAERATSISVARKQA
jgi:RNA polymerase sigma-70 factor (ECF subfamily)